MPTAVEKAAAKLAKLQAEASELKVEFTEETTAEELAEKIKEAKKAAKGSKSSFTVHKDGSPVRTYSVERHGDNAGDLAEEYAKKIGGEVR